MKRGLRCSITSDRFSMNRLVCCLRACNLGAAAVCFSRLARKRANRKRCVKYEWRQARPAAWVNRRQVDTDRTAAGDDRRAAAAVQRGGYRGGGPLRGRGRHGGGGRQRAGDRAGGEPVHGAFAGRQRRALADDWARGSLRRAVHTSILFALLGGVLFAVGGELAAAKLMPLLSVPEEVRGMALTYLRIYFLGLPVIFLYNFEAAVCRARGALPRR